MQLNLEKSMTLYEEALELLPAGVSSNARLWYRLCPSYVPCSIYVAKAEGSRLWDVDGNEYVDYRLGFGPVILGHSYAPVHEMVHRMDEHGLIFALSHELEITVAKKIRDMVPCAEMVRFANSGTEATMHALRVARAFTGREKVVKFEGMYHGAHDYLLFSVSPPFEGLSRARGPVPSSRGIPSAIRKLVITQRWNEFQEIEKTLSRFGSDIAALITEPVMGNAAAIPPQPGYLQHLRKLCDEHDIVLIFDEVKTGFRLAPGGAQELFGVVPDMATFAKSMGNGYPVAAFTGRREIMENIGPEKVVHGGTYASNPISLTAVDATLNELRKGVVHRHLNGYGQRLMKGLGEVLKDRDVPHQILGYPPMFQLVFTHAQEIKEYRDLEKCDFDLYARLHREMLPRRVMIDEDNEEAWFTCYAHSAEDLNVTLSAFREAIDEAIAARKAG
jgi:glutamate-1-semialdehyde 2,1-aminomutase